MKKSSTKKITGTVLLYFVGNKYILFSYGVLPCLLSVLQMYDVASVLRLLLQILDPTPYVMDRLFVASTETARYLTPPIKWRYPLTPSPPRLRPTPVSPLSFHCTLLNKNARGVQTRNRVCGAPGDGAGARVRQGRSAVDHTPDVPTQPLQARSRGHEPGRFYSQVGVAFCPEFN